MEQHLIAMDTRIAANENVLTNTGAQVAQIMEQMASFTERMEDINAAMTTHKTTIDAEKAAVVQALNRELDEHKAALAQVVNEARTEFDQVRRNLSTLFGGTGKGFQEIKTKVEALETEIAQFRVHGTGGGGAQTKGFLPIKEQLPGKFGKTEEEWRRWQEDVTEYFDTVRPGLKDVLKEAEKSKDAIDPAWLVNMANKSPVCTPDNSVHLFRALRTLTEAEARMVLQGVRDENGFEAWRQLNLRFGLSVAAKQGQAMCYVTSMVTKPAKTPAETRTLVVELERRVRMAEEITDRALDDGHTKSILCAILDPTTRAHTSSYMGAATPYHELKKAVLEFVANNTAATTPDPDAMVLGQVTTDDSAKQCDWYAQDQNFDGAPETLAALGPNAQCFKCHGYGHVASQCPSPEPKGKGKSGRSGDSSKGKGKGPMTLGKGGKGGLLGKGGKAQGKGGPKGGCWTCGGAHYHASCPYTVQGKGLGKGANSVGEWPTPAEATGVHHLCLVKTYVPSKLKLHNRFEQLQERLDEGEVEEPGPKDNMLRDNMHVRAGRKQGSGSTNAKEIVHKLCPLATIEPESVRAIGQDPAWEEVDMAVDSGASETVIPEDILPQVDLKPSVGSRKGVLYEVANGERIPNLGEKVVTGLTDQEGLERAIRAQVCQVNKPLLSVHRLVQAGNTVVFSPDGSYIKDANGGELWLREAGGMYHLKLWVPTASAVATDF